MLLLPLREVVQKNLRQEFILRPAPITAQRDQVSVEK
jgi:hypothetical protein